MNMSIPKVSVIVPNYNHAKFLKQRLDSILNQTYQDFEVIILDDCSTDNSKEIIESYRNNQKITKIVYNTNNSGSPFKQWKKGIELAKGEYIWIAESDDYSSDIFLEKLFIKTQQHNVGLCYSDSYEITETNEILRKWSIWQERLNQNIWTDDFMMDGKSLNHTYNLLYNIIPNASSAIFSKHLFESSEYYDYIDTLNYNGDWWMWFSILKKTKLYYHHQPLNFFRYHDHTTRNDTKNAAKIAFEDYHSILTFRGKRNKILSKDILTVNRMSEIFNRWNPSVKDFLKRKNFKTILLALQTDPAFLKKILQKLKARFLTSCHL